MPSKHRPTIADIMTHASAGCRQRNTSDYPNAPAATLPGVEKTPKTPKFSTLTAAEREWGAALKKSNPGAYIASQAKGFFTLAGSVDTYTPDFIVVHDFLPIEVWEVKGGYRGPGWEQGYERYKRAAAQYSDGKRFQFYLAEKTKNGWVRTKWGIDF